MWRQANVAKVKLHFESILIRGLMNYTFAGWQAIEAAELARGNVDRHPRNKFTDVADMLAAAAKAPKPPLRQRLADRLRQFA